MRRRVKLKDVCLDVTVGHVGPMADEYVASGIPFLRSQNILPFRLDGSNLKYISEEFHKRLKKSALSPGDVVVVRTGYPGTACVIPKRLPVSNCADLVVIHPSDEIDSHYLCCIFNSAWGRSTVSGSLVGVAQQHFNIGVAKEMEITLPPICTQRRIASILSIYDDLIENNTRRIKILEEMAQMIYREWFVNFRFPGHENVPMVKSELGRIPENWEVKKISEIARVKGGKRLPHGEVVLDAPTPHPYLRVKDMLASGVDLGEIKYISEDAHRQIMRYTVADTDIYISIAGTIGRVGIVPHFLSGANLTENAAKITDINGSSRFLLLAQLRDAVGQAQIASKVAGTSQPKLALYKIEEIKLLVPEFSLLERADWIFAPLHQQIQALTLKNLNLRTTRDLLLPRLISGEIPVAAAENVSAELVAQPA